LDFFSYTSLGHNWAQPLGGMNSFVPRKRRPFFGHQEPSKIPLNHLSSYNNFQYSQQQQQQKQHQQQQQQSINFRGLIFDYLENTTLHGMKYIAQHERRWYER